MDQDQATSPASKTSSCEGDAPEPSERPRMAKARPAQRRFDRLIRLVSEPGFDRLQAAHVVIFGLGGVGGFAAEGLVRSGVGHLTLVDFDTVCATNVNRQLQALHGNVGGSKVELLRERLRLINPNARLDAVQQFYCEANAATLLPEATPPTFVVDAIDNVSAKMHLLDRCRTLGIPVVSSMGAAGKLDPSAIRIADLYETHTDPLARALRKQLRRHYAWPENADKKRPVKSGVVVVYSEESRRLPLPPSWDRDHGFQCICPDGDNDVHTCSSRHVIEGSAVFVTSVFGMAAAGVVVRTLVGQDAAPTQVERQLAQPSAEAAGCCSHGEHG